MLSQPGRARKTLGTVGKVAEWWRRGSVCYLSEVKEPWPGRIVLRSVRQVPCRSDRCRDVDVLAGGGHKNKVEGVGERGKGEGMEGMDGMLLASD